MSTLSYNDLVKLIENKSISSNNKLLKQVQPSSIDLTISNEAYRMPGSILPLPDEDIESLIGSMALEKINIDNGYILSRGQVYLIKLNEKFNLPESLEAYTNSKSSIGRLDLATRTISNNNPRYDRICPGYNGDIWVELIPRSFDIIVNTSDSLNQAIFFENRKVLNNSELHDAYKNQPLLWTKNNHRVSPDDCIVDDKVVMTVDLNKKIVGYAAKRSHMPINLRNIHHYNCKDFFNPIYKSSNFVYLEKDHFYIFSTCEKIVVPNNLACEMMAYDPTAGEFRSHYAGFFDPGWGIIDRIQEGREAVLEIRSHENDFIIRHGQPICAMVYEELTGPSGMLYGQLDNNYADQKGLMLSKHFKNN